MSDHFRLTTHALGGVARDVSIRQPREGENPAHVAVSAYEYTMRNAQPGTQVTLYRNGWFKVSDVLTIARSWMVQAPDEDAARDRALNEGPPNDPSFEEEQVDAEPYETEEIEGYQPPAPPVPPVGPGLCGAISTPYSLAVNLWELAWAHQRAGCGADCAVSLSRVEEAARLLVEAGVGMWGAAFASTAERKDFQQWEWPR